MNKIAPLVSAPSAPALREMGLKINEISAALTPLLNIIGRNGVKVTLSDNNIVVEAPKDGTGDGGGLLPSGYTFEEFTICVNGSPETRFWPTWTSDPT